MSAREKILRQINEIGQALFGMDDIIKIYCLTKAADLTVLLLGPHATAKSTLARLWSMTTGLNYRVVTSCFDPDTELLTENGWEKISTIPVTRKLATINLNTGELEYQLPIRKIIQAYTGKLLSFKNKTIDILVTPNHRLVYKLDDGTLTLKDAASLFKQELHLKNTVTWKGYSPELLDLAFLGKTQTKPFLKFLGYWLASGYLNCSVKSYDVYFEHENEDVIEEYVKTAKTLAWNPIREADNRVRITDERLYHYLKHLEDLGRLPRDFLKLSPDCLVVLFTSWMRCSDKSSSLWHKGYSASKQLIDDMQEVAFKLGLPSYIIARKRRNGVLEYVLNVNYVKDDPVIKYQERQDKSINYSGLVYCFSTPNQTLIARRNGKIFCSGNSEVDESLICYIDPAVFREKNIVQMRRGELMEKDHIIVDEYFLWLNKYRAKLHQLLEERTYAGLDSLVKTYSFLCLDSGTEVLTRNGWKTYDAIQYSDEVLAVNPHNSRLEWVEVLSKYTFKHIGEMISIKGAALDILVTSNHKFPVRDKSFSFMKWKIASDLQVGIDNILLTGKPLVKREEIVSDAIVELVAWLKVYGEYIHSDLLAITVNGKTALKMLEKLLGSARIQVHSVERVNKRTYRVTFFTDESVLLEAAKSRVIRVEDVKLFSTRQLSLFLVTLLGLLNKELTNTCIVVRDKESADTIQYIATLLGVNSIVEEHYSCIKGRKKKIWRVTLRFGVLEEPITEIKKEHYSGLVWCLTTKYHNFVVRRNGKIHVTGNSNPLSDYYAGQIPEVNMATMDRIDTVLFVNQPRILPSERMLRKFSSLGRKEKSLKKVIDWDDYLKAREEILSVEVPPRIVVWLSLFAHQLSTCKHVKDKWSISPVKMRELCNSCNENAHICSKAILSKPRFLRATILLAKGLAWLEGQDTVSFKHVNEAIKYTLPLRLAWLGQEVSITEAIDKITEILQQFNDEMIAWKNRGIFSRLVELIEEAKKTPPHYRDELVQELNAEVSEIFMLRDFVNETAQTVKGDVKQYYIMLGLKKRFKTIREAEDFLLGSGLNAFDRAELLFDILKDSNLYLSYPIGDEEIEKLIEAIVTIHKDSGLTIEDKHVLLKKLADNVSFDSQLIKVRECGDIMEILLYDENVKEKFQNIMEAS